jgi:hypothetical protein
MTTMELNAEKVEFIKKFLNENDEALLIKVIAYFHKAKEITTEAPCQFTVEELKSELLKSEEDFRTGQYVTMEYMKAKHSRI